MLYEGFTRKAKCLVCEKADIIQYSIVCICKNMFAVQYTHRTFILTFALISVHVIRNLMFTVYGHYVGSNFYCGNSNILMEAGSSSSEEMSP